MSSLKTALVILLFVQFAAAQGPPDDPFAHTYSIVAVDTATGEIGAAVQSHWFSVGTVVIWAEAGVGAVATQSFVNVALGPRGLELMRAGATAQQALDLLIANDEGRDFRQLGMVDVKGGSATHTGAKCVQAAGHITKPGYSIQANLMEKDTVWPAMEQAFLQAKGPLAERLLVALQAAEGQGGDIRGRQSAALLVVKAKSSGKPWQDRLVDLRVDDHAEPLQELQRLLKVHRAYDHMNAGDLAIENQDEAAALREYGAAMEMFPDNLEMKYWTAVSLANSKQLDKALPLFKTVFKGDKRWRVLTPRLIDNGMLLVSPEELARIVRQ